MTAASHQLGRLEPMKHFKQFRTVMHRPSFAALALPNRRREINSDVAHTSIPTYLMGVTTAAYDHADDAALHLAPSVRPASSPPLVPSALESPAWAGTPEIVVGSQKSEPFREGLAKQNTLGTFFVASFLYMEGPV